MKSLKEQDLQKAILDYLRLRKVLCFKHRNAGTFKQKTGSFIPLPPGERGISDIIGCLKGGRFLAIEVKRPGAAPTPAQLDFIDSVNQQGGLGFVAQSVDDVMKYV